MRRNHGSVLLAVMAVVMLAAMLAATLLFRMRAETAGATAGTRQHQAYAAALSGIHTAMAWLSQTRDQPELWLDMPESFRNVPVADDGATQWYFTVYAEALDNSGTIHFGVRDEASLVNLNTADATMLARLPNMDANLIDALLDFIDADSTPRTQGAEQDVYDQGRMPIVVRNRPLTSIDQLLLIRGFDAKLVYGEDANLNGRLDPSEDDGDQSLPLDDADGSLNRGLRPWMTVWSSEPNVDRSGKPRININTQASQLSSANLGLPSETIAFIQAYRADGRTFTDPSQLLQMRFQPTRRRGGGNGNNPRGGAQSGGNNDTPELESQVGEAELPIVLDKLTTQANNTLTGRINVNTAPAGILAMLPEVDENLAQQIVEARPNVEAEAKRTPAWLFTKGLVNAEIFKRIAPMLTARSVQFRVRCVGFGWPHGKFRTLEAVVDVSGPPRIVYLRDITRAGPPVPFDVDGRSVASGS